MKYAIVTSGGKQYRVSEGETVVVDQLPVAVDSVYEFPEVLLFVDEATKEVGTPTVGVSVVGKVVEHIKGDKVRVSKFKAKAKYRRVTGFRAALTKVEIQSIGGKKAKNK